MRGAPATVELSPHLAGEAALPGQHFNERHRDRQCLPRLAVPTPLSSPRAFSSEVDAASRQGNASKQESSAPFRFHRNGIGVRASAPADALKERRDLRGRAIRIFPMREVTGAGKHREIERAERLAEPIGPRIGKQRIVLGPAHAGRHIDRRQQQGFALHHRDAPGMRGAIMRKAAGEIAVLEEVVGEGVEDVVEGVFSMRPALQEVADIKAAVVAAGADERGRHLHLVEGLVPDVVEPIGRRHARSDAGIDEIEEKQPRELPQCPPRQRLHHGATDIVADDAESVDAEPVHQRQHVGRMPVRPVRPVRLVAVAEAAQIGRDQREAIGQPGHHRLPGQPEFRPTMQQKQRFAVAGADQVEIGAIGLDRQMLHSGSSRAEGRGGERGSGFSPFAPCLARHPRLLTPPTTGALLLIWRLQERWQSG